MKCQAAYVWILASKATATLPDEVQRHLGHCRRCQRCQRRLLRLEAELKRPPAALEDPEVKARLFRGLAPLPRQVAPSSPPPPALRGQRSQRFFALATAAAVVFGLCLGWLLGRHGNTSKVESPTGSSSIALPAKKPPPVDIVVLAINHDLSLAETWAPAVQVRTLGELAADLSREALRLARQGPLEELPLMATLYQRVLRRGLIGRARVLPAEQRPAVRGPLARQLQESAAETDRVAEETLPALAEHFKAMAVVARDTS